MGHRQAVWGQGICSVFVIVQDVRKLSPKFKQHPKNLYHFHLGGFNSQTPSSRLLSQPPQARFGRLGSTWTWTRPGTGWRPWDQAWEWPEALAEGPGPWPILSFPTKINNDFSVFCEKQSVGRGARASGQSLARYLSSTFHLGRSFVSPHFCLCLVSAMFPFCPKLHLSCSCVSS